MKLKPLHDWAVIKRLNAEEKTSGGIIIPASAQEKPSEGVVIRIGPGRYKMEKGRLKFTPTIIKTRAESLISGIFCCRGRA